MLDVQDQDLSLYSNKLSPLSVLAAVVLTSEHHRLNQSKHFTCTGFKLIRCTRLSEHTTSKLTLFLSSLFIQRLGRKLAQLVAIFSSPLSFSGRPPKK